jgi:hypothetical protein
MALAATATAAQAAITAPHWYKCEPDSLGLFEAGCTASGSKYEKFVLTSTPVTVKLKGGLSFKVSEKKAIECDATGSGEILNPSADGAGEGVITLLALEPCGGGGCTSAPTLLPLGLGLGWKTLLKVVGTQITDEIKAVEIEVKCPGMLVDEFVGHLNPEVVNGVPSLLKFTSATGTLLDSSHLSVQVTGTLSVEGPTGETVLAENP